MTVTPFDPVAGASPNPCGPLPPFGVAGLWVGWQASVFAGDGLLSREPCSGYHWAGPDGAVIAIRPLGPDEVPPPATLEAPVMAGRPAVAFREQDGVYLLVFSLSGASGDHRYLLTGRNVAEGDMWMVAKALVPGNVPGDDHYPARAASALGDGRHPVRIVGADQDSVTVEPLSWDPAQGGRPSPVPDGRSDNLRSFALDPAEVAVATTWRPEGLMPGFGEMNSGKTRASGYLGEWLEHWTGDTAARFRLDVHWVTVHAGRVTRIDGP